jgi:cell division septation protein DedD
VIFHVRYLSVILGLFLSAFMAHLVGVDLSLLDKLLPSKNEILEETPFKKVKVAPKKNQRNKSENKETSYTFFEVLTGEKNDNFVDMDSRGLPSSKKAKDLKVKEIDTPRQITTSIKGEKVEVAVKAIDKLVKKVSTQKTSPDNKISKQISTDKLVKKVSNQKTSPDNKISKQISTDKLVKKVSTPKTSSDKMIPTKVSTSGGKYVVQAGSFKKIDSANRLVARLKNKGYSAYWKEKEVGNGKWFRVFLGSFPTQEDALVIVQKARAEEKLDPMIYFQKN